MTIYWKMQPRNIFLQFSSNLKAVNQSFFIVVTFKLSAFGTPLFIISGTYKRRDIKTIWELPIIDDTFSSYFKYVNFMVREKFWNTGIIYSKLDFFYHILAI